MQTETHKLILCISSKAQVKNQFYIENIQPLQSDYGQHVESPGWIKFGVRSTSIQVVLEPKVSIASA